MASITGMFAIFCESWRSPQMKNPEIFSSTDESGDLDLENFQENIIQGLQHYINQIFIIEKPNVAEIARRLNVSEPTLYRIRNCQYTDLKYLPKLVELASLLGVKAKVNFVLTK